MSFRNIHPIHPPHPFRQPARLRRHTPSALRASLTGLPLADDHRTDTKPYDVDGFEGVNLAGEASLTAVKEELAAALRLGWRAALPPAVAAAPVVDPPEQ